MKKHYTRHQATKRHKEKILFALNTNRFCLSLRLPALVVCLWR